MESHSGIKILSTVDYIVFGLTLVISAAIGIYFRFTGGKQKTTEEFLLAGKNMSIWPVAFSLMATFKSAIAFIGFPSEIYMYGTAIIWNQIWHIPGSVVAGFLFLPSYFDLGCSTAYEFLRRRFGPVMRLIGSVAFIGQMMLYMSVVLYAPALALSAVTSISLWISIVSVGVVCTVYCTLGGMKAVLWTDAFQAVVMYMGLLALIIVGCLDLGGGDNVIQMAKEGGRFIIPSYDFDLSTRYTFWNVIAQGFLMSIATYGCNQIQIQRILTVKNVNQARKALFVSVAMSFVFMFLLAFVGIVMYAYFRNCDPLSLPGLHIHKKDQLLPYYAMVLLDKFPGLPGLCISSVFSASLSTVSSALNSLTTVTIEDFILPFCGNRKTSVSNSVFFAKIITFVYGGLGIVGTLVVARFGGVLQATFTIFGIFHGPMLGAFFLGMFTTTANETGVALATLASIAVVAWSSFGAAAVGAKQPTLVLSTEGCPVNTSYSSLSSVPDLFNTTVTSTETIVPEDGIRDIFPLYKISFMWLIGMGFVLTAIGGYCFSQIINTFTGKKPIFVPECLNPMMRKYLLPDHKEENISDKAQKDKNVAATDQDDQNRRRRSSSKNGVLNVSFDLSLNDELTTKF